MNRHEGLFIGADTRGFELRAHPVNQADVYEILVWWDDDKGRWYAGPAPRSMIPIALAALREETAERAAASD